MLMRVMGTEEYIVELWQNAHLYSVLYDRKNGFRASVSYQRKSGDASTWCGNTVFLKFVIAYLYDLTGCPLVLFSGDDSLILGGQPRVEVVESVAALLLNLEAKIYSKYVYPYFCSKFLLFNGYEVIFVPDPLKLVTKLGRPSLVNWEHAEDYRVSIADLVTDYASPHNHQVMTNALVERYAILHPPGTFSAVFSTIVTLVSDSELFKKLFYSLPTDVLCMDPSRPSLD